MIGPACLGAQAGSSDGRSEPELPLPTAEIRQKGARRRSKLIAPIADKSFLVRALRYSTVSIRISFDSGIFRAVTAEKKRPVSGSAEEL
jgi:hypothetical protein